MKGWKELSSFQSELLKLADERMYENKVAIKISRGDDPDAR